MKVGRYEVVRKLAAGGMAEVFLAKAAGPMGFEKTLVLKRILPHMAEDPTFIEMFLSEARLAAQLNHPNIVQIFDFGEAEGAYYLAMEYIDGPNLRVLAKRARARGLALHPALCARIISSACEGLAFAHDFRDPATGQPLDLIHRDISPDNLLLSLQGAVKVVDFGIAKVANQGHKTQTGVLKGKFSYMPPEQLRCQPVDRRVDVYALGIVFYELLTGHKPFDATTNEGIMQAVFFEPFVPAVERRPDLPVALQRILERALAKKREQRYPDCRALQRDLDRFVVSTTGESLGAFQIAQFISRVMDEPGAPAPRLGSESPAAPRPTEAELATEPPKASPAGARREEVRASRPPKPARPGWNEAPTLPFRPARREEVPATLEDASALELPSSSSPWRRPVFMAAALAAVMLMTGAGYLSWSPRTNRQERPEKKPADVGQKAPTPHPVQPPRPPVQAPAAPAPLGKGTVEFRVVPFATVLLDGKELGVTPFEPVEVVEGRHTVRLINHELGKEVTRELTVEANRESVFKFNLLKE